MSGIEVVLIIGAGILITKKVREHREEKKRRLDQEHGQAELMADAKDAATTEEALPLYTASEKEHHPHRPADHIRLPTYEQTVAVDVHGPGAASRVPVGSEKPRRWRKWRQTKDKESLLNQTDKQDTRL